jgi:hypothetical protein
MSKIEKQSVQDKGFGKLAAGQYSEASRQKPRIYDQIEPSVKYSG